jgi:light-regulated signal transduction histidine kinase (bacteriophytochrome)
VTQPLTPVTDRAVEAQLIQQLSKGEIKFDLDRGRMLSKQLDWSEEVVGFRGAETSLRYDAKFTEELISPAKRTASRGRAGSK